MQTSKLNVEEALTNVRIAYRLLHDYQQAVLDAVRYVGAQLGLEYCDGAPRFSNPPPRGGRNALGCWAWDWLNMVFYDFHFKKNGKGKELNLVIRLLSDTGYYLSDGATERKTASFASPELSKTVVGFLFYSESQPGFDQLFEKANVKKFVETGGELPAALRASGMVGKCYSFARISDEASADGVVSELIQTAQENGFALEPLRKRA